MDYAELSYYFEAYQKNQELQQKQRISELYALSSLTAQFISLKFAGAKLPTIYEVYPELFPQEVDANVLKDEFVAFAEQFNANRRSNV